MADLTKRTRLAQWRQFINFHDDYKLTAVLAWARVLTLFIAHLAEQGLEHNSVLKYLHSVVSIHTTSDIDPPDLSHHL